jgi:hypothetical protein
MNTLSRTFNILSVIALSFFSGAFLFIAFVVVKFWQSIAPTTFLDWMSDHFFRFQMLMIPLNMTALLLTIVALGSAWNSRPASRLPLGLAVGCIFACTITYPIYFAGANAEFLSRTIELLQISDAIQTWVAWHWVRTGLAITAVSFSSWGVFVIPNTQVDKSIGNVNLIN